MKTENIICELCKVKYKQYIFDISPYLMNYCPTCFIKTAYNRIFVTNTTFACYINNNSIDTTNISKLNLHMLYVAYDNRFPKQELKLTKKQIESLLISELL